MNKTGPAHVVRETAREGKVEEIWAKILRAERAYGKREYFYHILVVLLGIEVAHCRIEVDIDAFEAIPGFIAKQILDFFEDEVRAPIRTFERSKQEGDDLFVRLLEKTEVPLASLHRGAVEKQEREEPQRMLQAENPMDQVPMDQYK
jgi:hypothetical protein